VGGGSGCCRTSGSTGFGGGSLLTTGALFVAAGGTVGSALKMLTTIQPTSTATVPRIIASALLLKRCRVGDGGGGGSGGISLTRITSRVAGGASNSDSVTGIVSSISFKQTN
jgi:hypothetical protein